MRKVNLQRSQRVWGLAVIALIAIVGIVVAYLYTSPPNRRTISFFTDDAVLDDPSVGRAFNGKAGIAKYFDEYFIGYDTSTRLVSITPEEGHQHVEVHFSGDFPGGKTDGIFDVTFKGEKISFVRADLA